MKNQFLSTPSARRATERLDEGVGDVVISIHALREEGDDCGTQGLRWIAISIHALREEGDISYVETDTETIVFLSTPSARRATHT